MKLDDMAKFQRKCRKEFVKVYNETQSKKIKYRDTYVVQACKSAQKGEALVSTTLPRNKIYARIVLNSDKKELCISIYKEQLNKKIIK